MKLIKAYVRTYKASKVVDVLERLRIHRLMAVHVEEIGHGVFKEYEHLDSALAQNYVEMIKIELICEDNEVENIKNEIISNARTDYKGDGIVVVSPIEEATSIRTGESIMKDE
ncbi:MAG: P-II family nitrogen regulator [Candidatus Omnitrophica bacterium]|nr:P-II family nitrogen regulator [Candidatus Omnitrophota bacterium]